LDELVNPETSSSRRLVTPRRSCYTSGQHCCQFPYRNSKRMVDTAIL
jgi:hypothetical protein